VSGGFGMRMHPIHKIPSSMRAWTSPPSRWGPIYATGDGRVTFADYATSGYGIHVVVDHGFAMRRCMRT
jgi:murein DD-endopeptidase MepM/ murein hydrolase activator NlpD